MQQILYDVGKIGNNTGITGEMMIHHRRCENNKQLRQCNIAAVDRDEQETTGTADKELEAEREVCKVATS